MSLSTFVLRYIFLFVTRFGFFFKIDNDIFGQRSIRILCAVGTEIYFQAVFRYVFFIDGLWIILKGLK